MSLTDTKTDVSLATLAAGIFQPHVIKIVSGFDHDLTDEQYTAYEPVIGANAMQTLIAAYDGAGMFLNQLKVRFVANKGLTLGQKRAVLNNLRRALRGETDTSFAEHTPYEEEKRVTIPAEGRYACFNGCGATFDSVSEVTRHRATCRHKPARVYRCFKCNKPGIVGIDALEAHKKVCSGKKGVYEGADLLTAPPSGPMVTAPGSAFIEPPPEVPVIPPYEPRLNLDLSPLPSSGRYALMMGPEEFLYFIIKRVKRASKVTHRFVWSKYRSGTEYLDPGDFHVRKQIGDTKELVGMQRFNKRHRFAGVYAGEFEDELALILKDPESAMMLYGIKMKACAYCGRSLTDEVSQARGIGPDCWEEKHLPALLRKGSGM